jgi:hypothetical protein
VQALENGRTTSNASSTSSIGLPPQYARRQPRYITGPVAGLEPTPPDEYAETDFTAWGRRPNSIRMRPSMSDDSRQSSFTMDMQSTRSNCGFCNDPQNCVCLMDSTEPDAAGNCDACAGNPARQAACRRLAQQARQPARDVERPMMGCAAFMDRVQATGARLPGVAEMIGSQVQVYTSGASGFEVEDHEAAQ